MGIEDEVRPGLVGYWDRFAGPRPSGLETAGTLAAVAAAALWADRDPDRGRVCPGVLMRLTAIDLWGGAWVNNTRSCVRWYERPGQGAREHVGFAALHLLHPALIAVADEAAGRRSRATAIGWTLGHYGWMLASSAVITRAPRRTRFALAIGATGAGIYLDRLLEPSRGAPWFAPVFYTKLIIGHAAGSVWNAGRLPTS